MMDQRLLVQIDQLQRGAREPFPRGPAHSQARSLRSDDDDRRIGGDLNLFDDAEMFGDENVQASFTTQYEPRSQESYGRSQMLPTQPDFHSRRSQMQRTPMPSGAGRFDLSQFTYSGGAAGGASSSSLRETLPSSPVVDANRRRSAAFGSRVEQQSRSAQMPDFMADDEDLEDHDYRRPLPTQPDHVARPPAMNRQAQRGIPRGAPVVQGIQLVSTHDLPDRFRSIFPFPLLNAVQSKCFPVVYSTNDNFVLSAPTGSGKTAVLELAICRLMSGFANSSFKIVYQAPTKSLCSERQRDWQRKFRPFDLEVAELTGDTDNAQLRNVQHASIIITTPEKWDSVTRKWKDQQKLMQMVKLFLIDEVHILKENRGATLEAIVSRMKSVGSDIRFVALSATVPNSQDIATWLGKDSVTPYIPAPRERFGEEFRPVPLAKHVCGYNAAGNDFAFENTLNAKLPGIIAKWSQRKPIMVFCFTRKSCEDTAKYLSSWWDSKGPRDRYWESPRKRVTMEDKDLLKTTSSGVAYHHAGVSANDRSAIEKAYLDGDINVICCTSTLAVGVNLPCHMVIIKHTVAYGGPGGCKEYSDLEVMQMLGRAGRPQFDKSAVAVILTRLQKQNHYEKMVTGQEILESCLHRNLIDHFNAEIGLGTITSASTAKKWLRGTFLYVRLKENPEHYKIDGDASGNNLDERLDIICGKAVTLLEETQLVESQPRLHCTEFGNAMARYYLQFETMKSLLGLPRGAKTSEILSCVAQASEFSEIRFRAGEKPTYKAINQNSSIKFPIPVNLDAPAHKVSLVIQVVLGAVDFPSEDNKQHTEFLSAKSLIFQSVQRLIRCVIDCNIHLEDAVTTRNALGLARSLGAQAWDDLPLHMKQLDGIGPVSVRKLVAANLRTAKDIADEEHYRLESLLSRKPPFGIQLQNQAKAFPKLRVDMKMIGEPVVRPDQPVTIKICATIAFMNEKPPETFHNKPFSVCFLAELSDGKMVYFARISANKLKSGQEIQFEAKLTHETQNITGNAMCDTIAGTLETAFLQTKLPPNAFPRPKPSGQYGKPVDKTSKATHKTKFMDGANSKRKVSNTSFDEFGVDRINDSDIVAMADGFQDIDDFENDAPAGLVNVKKRKGTSAHDAAAEASTVEHEPRQLANGKWACNHKCKDKNACRHLCCREGLDKKPKMPKPKSSNAQVDTSLDARQTQLNMSVSKKATTPSSATSGQSQRPEPSGSRKPPNVSEMRSLDTLHMNVPSNTRDIPVLNSASSVSDNFGALHKSARFGSAFVRAARRAESDQWWDDFNGQLDLTNLNSAQSTISKGGSSGLQSGLFESYNNVFVDSGSADQGGPLVRPEMVSLNQRPLGLSSPDFGGFNMDPDLDFEDHGSAKELYGVSAHAKKPQESSEPKNAQQTWRKDKNAKPIAQESSDSAAFDLGVLGQNNTESAVTSGSLKDWTVARDTKAGVPTGLAAIVGHHNDTESADERQQGCDPMNIMLIEEFGDDLFNLVD